MSKEGFSLGNGKVKDMDRNFGGRDGENRGYCNGEGDALLECLISFTN